MTSKLAKLFRSKKTSDDIYDEDSDEDVEAAGEEIYEDDANGDESGHLKDRMEDIADLTNGINDLDGRNCDVKVPMTPGGKKSGRNRGAIFYADGEINIKQEEKTISKERDDQGKLGDSKSKIDRKEMNIERSIEESNEIYDSDEHADIGPLEIQASGKYMEVVEKDAMETRKKCQSNIKSPRKFISEQMDLLETKRKVVTAHIGRTSEKLRGRIKERAKDKNDRGEKYVEQDKFLDVEEMYDEDEGQNENMENTVTQRQNMDSGKETNMLEDINYDDDKKKGMKETKGSKNSIKKVSKPFEKFDKKPLKSIEKKVSSPIVQNKKTVKKKEDSAVSEEDVYDSDEHDNSFPKNLDDQHENVESVEDQQLHVRKKSIGNLKTSMKFLNKHIRKMEESRKAIANKLEITTGKIKDRANDKKKQITEISEGDSIIEECGKVDDIYDEDEKELDNEIPANKKKAIQSTIIKPQPSMPSKTKDIKKEGKDEEIYDDDEELSAESKKDEVNEVDEIYDDDEKDLESISAMSTASKVSHELGAVRNHVSPFSLSKGMNTKIRGFLKKSDKISKCSTRKDILYQNKDLKDVTDSESKSEESFDDAFSDESGNMKTYIQKTLIKISQKLENRRKKFNNDNENGIPTSLKIKENKQIEGSIALNDDIYDSDDHEKEPTKLDEQEDIQKMEKRDLDVKKISNFSIKSSMKFLNNRINIKETKEKSHHKTKSNDKVQTLKKGKDKLKKNDFSPEHNDIVSIKEEELYNDDEKEFSDDAEESPSLEIPTVKHLKKLSITKRGKKSVEIEKEECEEVYDDDEKDSTSLSMVSTMSQEALKTRDKLDASATSKGWSTKMTSMLKRSNKKSSIKSIESFEDKVPKEGGESQSDESFDEAGIEEATYLKSYLKKKFLSLSERLGTKRQKSLKSDLKKREDEEEANEDIYDSDEHENGTIEECEVTIENESERKIKNILRKSSMRFLSREIYMQETKALNKERRRKEVPGLEEHQERKSRHPEENDDNEVYDDDREDARLDSTASSLSRTSITKTNTPKSSSAWNKKIKSMFGNIVDPSLKELRKNTNVQDNNAANFLESTPLEPKVKELNEIGEDAKGIQSTNVQKYLERKLLAVSRKHGIETTNGNGLLTNARNLSSMNEEEIYDEEEQEDVSLDEILDSSVANETVESKEARSKKKSNGNLRMPIRFIKKHVRLMEAGSKVVANRLEVTTERLKDRIKEKKKQKDDIYDDDDNMEQEVEKLHEDVRTNSLANGKNNEIHDRNKKKLKETNLKDDDNEIYDDDVTDEVVQEAKEVMKEKDEEIYDDDEEDGEKKLLKEGDCEDLYDDDEKDNLSVSTVSVKSKVSHHKEYAKYKHSISSVSKDLNKKLKGLLKSSDKKLPKKSKKDTKDSEEESEESFDDAFSDDSNNMKTYIQSKLLRIALNLDKKKKTVIKEKEKGPRNIRKSEDLIEKSTDVGDDVYDSDDHDKGIQEENGNEEVPRVEKKDQEPKKFTITSSKNFFNKQMDMLEANRKMIVTRLEVTAGRIKGNFESRVRKADCIYDDDDNLNEHVGVNESRDAYQAETKDPSKKAGEDDINEIYDDDETDDKVQDIKNVKSNVKVKSEKNFTKELEIEVKVKGNLKVKGKEESLKMIENQEEEKNDEIYDDDEREDEVDTTSSNSKPSGSNKTINAPKKVSLSSVSKDLNKKLLSALKKSKKNYKDLTNFYDFELPEERETVFDETFDNPSFYDSRNLKGFIQNSLDTKTETIDKKMKETSSNVTTITEDNDMYDIDEHMDLGPSKIPGSQDCVKVVGNDKTEIKKKSQSKMKSGMKFLSKHIDVLETKRKATHVGETSGKFRGRIKEGAKENDDRCKEKVETNECLEEEELYDDDEGGNEALNEEKVVTQRQYINEKKETATIEDIIYDDKKKGRTNRKGSKGLVKKVPNLLEKFDKRSTEIKISTPVIQKKKAEKTKEDPVVGNDDVYDSEELEDVPPKDLCDDHDDVEVIENQESLGKKKSYGNLKTPMKFLNKHVKKMEVSRKVVVNKLEMTAGKIKDRIKDKVKQKTVDFERDTIVEEGGEVEDIYDEDEQEVCKQEERHVAPDRGGQEYQHQGNEDLELTKERKESNEAPRTAMDVEEEEIYDEDEEVTEGCPIDKVVTSTPITLNKKSKTKGESIIKHPRGMEEDIGAEDNTYDSDGHDDTKTNVDKELLRHVENQEMPTKKRFYFHFKSSKNLKGKPIKSTSKTIIKERRDAENEDGNVYEEDEGTEGATESSKLMKEDSSEEKEGQQIQAVPSTSRKQNPRESENDEIYDADECLNEGDMDQIESVRKKSNRTLNFFSKKIANLESKGKKFTTNVSMNFIEKKGKVKDIEKGSHREVTSQEMTEWNRDDGEDVYDSDELPKENPIQIGNVTDSPQIASKGLKYLKEEKKTISNQIKNKFLQFRRKSSNVDECSENTKVEEGVEIPGRGSTAEIGDNVYESKSDDNLPQIDVSPPETDPQGASTSPSTELTNGPQHNFVSIRDRIKRFEKPP